MGPVCLLVLIFVSAINGQSVNSRTANRFRSSRQLSGGLDDDVLPADDFNVRRPVSNFLATGDDDNRVFGDISNSAVRVSAPRFQPFLLQGLNQDQRRIVQQRPPPRSLAPFFSHNLFRPKGFQQTPVNNFLPNRGSTRRQRPTTRPTIQVFATRRPAIQQFRPTQSPLPYYSGGPRNIDDIRSSFNYRPPNDEFGVHFDFFENDEVTEQSQGTVRPRQVQPVRPIQNPQPVRTARPIPNPQPARPVRPINYRPNNDFDINVDILRNTEVAQQTPRRARPQQVRTVRRRPSPQQVRNLRPRPRPQQVRTGRQRPSPQQVRNIRPRPRPRPIVGIRQPQPRPNFRKISDHRENRLPESRQILNEQSTVEMQPETFPDHGETVIASKPIYTVDPRENPTPKPPVKRAKQQRVTVPPTPKAPRLRTRQSRRRSRQRSRRQRLRQTIRQSNDERRFELPETAPPSSNSLLREGPQRTRNQQTVSVESRQPRENPQTYVNTRNQLPLPQQRPPRIRSVVQPTDPAPTEEQRSPPERKEQKRLKVSFQNNIYPSPLTAGEIPDDMDGDGSPGKAGREYPIYDKIPKTSFSCLDQKSLGYYSDPEAQCQVFHFCQAGGIKSSFLCPNGTLYNQAKLACEWWHNVDCSSTPNHYHVNDRLYKDPVDELDDFLYRFCEQCRSFSDRILSCK
ncbi:hypothetical protein GQR58_010120 [Nymphon striatum]|nr:hypothetical protein GQR58_010120 [Nymphon striatum]